MCTQDKDSAWTRYLTLGVDADGNLHHILARRGHAPADIVRQTLDINTRGRRKGCEKFVRLYVLEVGPEGTYGNSTHLKLQEIVKPPPCDYRLMPVRGLY